MGDSSLSTTARNRALLARQLLLDRRPLSIVEAVEHMAGIQAQYAPAMYVALRSRLAGFERDDLTSALEVGEVVQGTLMRSTIHLVSRADYWPMAIAVREARRRQQLRAGLTGASEGELVDAAGRLRDALVAAGEPLARKDAEALTGMGRLLAAGLWVDLVRVPPSGTWSRRRADRFELAERWVGPPPPLDPAAAHVHLLRRYLAGFGPATVAEAADWSGLPPADVQAALTRLDTVEVGTDDGTVLVDLGGLPTALTPGEVAAPVRLLGHWDASLLVHARRKVVIAEEDRLRIFRTKVPQSFATLLVDGRVAGTWTHDGERIVVEAWRPLPEAVAREVDAEAARMAGLW